MSYSGFLLKPADTPQIGLKSIKYNKHFTWKSYAHLWYLADIVLYNWDRRRFLRGKTTCKCQRNICQYKRNRDAWQTFPVYRITVAMYRLWSTADLLLKHGQTLHRVLRLNVQTHFQNNRSLVFLLKLFTNSKLRVKKLERRESYALRKFPSLFQITFFT